MIHHHDTYDYFSERFLHPTLHLLGRTYSAARIFGATGFLLALILAALLATLRGLSVVLAASTISFAMLMLIVQSHALEHRTGKECLVYYRATLFALISVAALLYATGQPVLPYLDIATLGVGMITACGRIGCLLAGCSHGAPHRWGVRYNPEHVESGFPRWLVGVRLFPVQALEALLIVHIAAAGTLMLFDGAAPGEIVAWYVITYATGRFAIDFLRGDSGQLYFQGFSETQWISLMLVAFTCVMEFIGILPIVGWHVAALLFILLWMTAATIIWRFERSRRHDLLHPQHILEIARALEHLDLRRNQPGTDEESQSKPSRPVVTSLDLQISGGIIGDDAWCAHHYSISRRGYPLGREEAETMANLIVKLSGKGNGLDLIKGKNNVFHLLVYPENEALVFTIDD